MHVFMYTPHLQYTVAPRPALLQTQTHCRTAKKATSTCAWYLYTVTRRTDVRSRGYRIHHGLLRHGLSHGQQLAMAFLFIGQLLLGFAAQHLFLRQKDSPSPDCSGEGGGGGGAAEGIEFISLSVCRSSSPACRLGPKCESNVQVKTKERFIFLKNAFRNIFMSCIVGVVSTKVKVI